VKYCCRVQDVPSDEVGCAAQGWRLLKAAKRKLGLEYDDAGCTDQLYYIRFKLEPYNLRRTNINASPCLETSSSLS
jgi:hypothetical protein